MVTGLANIQQHISNSHFVLSFTQYRFLLLAAVLMILMVLAVLFLMPNVTRENSLSVAVGADQHTNLTNNLINMTPKQESYLLENQTADVTINGSNVPIAQEGTTRITVPIKDGQAIIDSTVHTERNGASTSSRSEITIQTHSSSNVTIEDTQ